MVRALPPVGRVHAAPKMALQETEAGIAHPPYTNTATCSGLTVDGETLGQSPPFR